MSRTLPCRSATAAAVRFSATALCVFSIFAFREQAGAEVTGRITEVSGSTATVEMSSGTAAVGDAVDFFFKLAGADDEISVGSGTVVSANGKSLKVKIENATGDVVKDQLVRLAQGKAKPSGAATTSSPEPSVSASPTNPAASPARGYVGMNIVNRDGESGVMVAALLEDGPAAAAGIQEGDVLIAIDGTPVEDFKQVAEATSRLQPGTRHAFLISRSGKVQKIEVTIAERPANFPAAGATPNE